MPVSRVRKSALQRRVEIAIRAWHHEHKSDQWDEARGVSHIYPRAYVLAKLAPQCVILAIPECDAEPQLQGPTYFGFQWCRRFDDSLVTGGWCSVAYLSTDGCGEHVAIPVVR